MGKAVKLSIQPTYDFLLIGLVTSEPIYRLSYLINEALQIQLTETNPIKIYHQKRNIYQAFDWFKYTHESLEMDFNLIHNKGIQGLLIEEQKQVDFWLKIDNPQLTATDIIQTLRLIKNINLVFEIKPGSLKSKNRMLF